MLGYRNKHWLAQPEKGAQLSAGGALAVPQWYAMAYSH